MSYHKCTGEEIDKEIIETDIHTISGVETFITKFQNDFRTPKLRGKGINSPPIDQEKKAVVPHVSPPLVLDSNYKPGDHVLNPNDARWINK